MSESNVENLSGFSMSEVRKEAEREIRDERIKKAKSKLKTKIMEVETARQVLRNAERELEALEHELESGVG